MKVLKKIGDFIIYGNFLIAAGAAAMVWESYIIFGREVNWLYVGIAFAATLFTYNIDRLLVLKSLAGVKSERHQWIVRYAKVMTVLCVLSVLFLISTVFFLPFRVLLFLSHLGFISLAYSIPFITQKTGRIPLRSIKGLKIFLITYVWAASTVMLPALDVSFSLLDKDVVLLSIERALFIFAITLPFDIRDYKSDKREEVHTIPGMIGVQQSRGLALACLLLMLLISVLHYPWLSQLWYAKVITAVVTFILVYNAREARHEYFFTGLLDGTIIFQFLMVLMLHH